MVIVIGAIILLALAIRSTTERDAAHAAERAAAHGAYVAPLDRLKSDPTNAERWQETLHLGRAYSQLTRERGVTLFDEVALMNDMNAASAGAPLRRSRPADV